ncbi:putative tubulin--tyrosine ligase C12B10.04 [Fusarium oxysporum f. sp. albedinis]|nr:putative tubulin--tyrosine ligase C12B10.04 [Fusarium oxysporum f. sp. albedinis]
MAAAEKLGKAICGVTVTGCRNFEGSIDFRRDLDTESRYSSFRDRNRVCLIGCDIRGIWNELSVSVRELSRMADRITSVMFCWDESCSYKHSEPSHETLNIFYSFTTEYDKPILAGVSLRHVSSSRGKIEKRQLQPTYGSKMSESRPVSSINAIAPTDNGNSNWQENKNKAYSYCKSTSSSYRPLIIMCVLTCTKYDCAQCQRAISGTEQLKECPESSQGIKCETTNECITENVSADQCEVCEMRRIEAEVAAAAEEEEAKRRQMRLKQ